MEKEIWKPICERYQNCKKNVWMSNDVYHIRPDKYEISNLGKIRNKYTNKILSVHGSDYGCVTLDTVGKNGTHYCKVGRCKYRVGRLVYSTFVEPIETNERIARGGKYWTNSTNNLHIRN